MCRKNLKRVAFLVVGLFTWFKILFFLLPPQSQQRPEDILLDPNAPVILVADDGKEDVQQAPLLALPPPPYTLPTIHPRNNTRQHGVRLKPGALANRFLVHSYDHGGGGVVSETLNLLLDDVFFLYQPLDKLNDQNLPGIHLKEEKVAESIAWLREVFNCSFNQKHELLNDPILSKSHSVRTAYYTYCHKHQVELMECVQLACQERPLRAVSVVRLSMLHIHQLLNIYSQQLKVVLVLRDPRAVLGARRRAAKQTILNSPVDFQLQASLLCNTMGADMREVSKLHHRYPRSVTVLRYEHLLLQPNQVLSYLYNFLGLQVTKSQLDSVIKTLRLDRSEQQLLQITKVE